ncbi:MAG: calcium-binding protein [Chloroflexi bacterium]|nr:calcium-binding protein [Chloroflexota bacterium]
MMGGQNGRFQYPPRLFIIRPRFCFILEGGGGRDTLIGGDGADLLLGQNGIVVMIFVMVGVGRIRPLPAKRRWIFLKSNLQ